jgi:hypothetical protein
MGVLTPHEFDQLTAAIRQARPAPRDVVIWGLDAISARAGCSVKTIRKLLKTDPTFPPVLVAGRWACTESALLRYFAKPDAPDPERNK